MFPIAHAWLLEQLVPEPTPAHYLGCVWPDMLFGSPLSHTQSHRSGVALVAYMQTFEDNADAATLRAFVTGVLTHGTEPHGFDWYSDEQYGGQPPEARGYAFQHGLPLASAAARACGLPEQQGWWKAHNLVEMAFEADLYKHQPSLGTKLLGVNTDAALIQAVTTQLAPFFGVAAHTLVPSIHSFFEVTQLQPANSASLARTYAMQTRLKHPDAQPDEAAIAVLIEHAERDTVADRDDYLAHCVAQVGAMLLEQGMK